MLRPKEVYDNPENYWSFITTGSDDEFESQHFDRKEAGRIGENGFVTKTELRNVRDQITECISAFANTNKDGGLLVLGVSSTGEVKGVSHLSEDQINNLTNFTQKLKSQSTLVHEHPCQNSDGNPDKIILIYVFYSSIGICETLDNQSKAWRRVSKQNLLMDDRQREHLKREKRIVDFELAYCCPFSPDDLDQDVLSEFRKSLAKLYGSPYQENDAAFLHNIGALVKDGDNYIFNNAGYLFFARNPQRRLSWAYARLLRFEAEHTDEHTRGLPSFERNFDGPLAHQIRKIRTFFRESGFFKIYQQRNPDGGFIDDPEFPPIAVDEAIVNAVAHREYAIQLPIECIHYKDAFVVENPGRILQRERDVPDEFSLADTELNSMPRNSKLIEWLKIMRTEEGQAFVRALSEGTKRMRDEMVTANLPPPFYRTSSRRTTVTLQNNATIRETLLRQAAQAQETTEYSNLFPLEFVTEQNKLAPYDDSRNRRKDFLAYLRDSLTAKGWFVDYFGFGRIVAHKRGQEVRVPSQVRSLIRLYPSYEFQLRDYWGKFYLCVDYTLSVKNVQSVSQLLQWIEPRNLRDQRAIAKMNNWQQGKIVRCNNERTRIYLYDHGAEERVPSNQVIPDLPISLLKTVLAKANISFDLSKEIKRHSLALQPNAAHARSEQTIAAVENISTTIFPLRIGELTAILTSEPTPLYHFKKQGAFQVQSLPEPAVEFHHSQETPDVRRGITTYGSYEDARKTIELIPVCTIAMREKMASLIERLKTGKFKYKGSERTFRTQLTYGTIVTVPSAEEMYEECSRLLNEHPNWCGNEQLNRLFLVHTPEKDYAQDDENSPYYRIKRLLLEQGIPCQMIDTPTLHNPDWKDLNLALNISAKCGVTPWVLPDSIPDADFFIGLSYTQTHRRGKRRLVGYATVFNKFGRWEFYSGNTDAFSYEERTTYFALLAERTLKKLHQQGRLPEQAHVYFHYSARFSHEDRQSILNTVRKIRPQGFFHFVSVNTHHSIRLYDARSETDGSLSRGSYVITAPNQVLLSTTGYNPFRKAIGTPKPLEVTIRSYPSENAILSGYDLHGLAAQILNLTKLNWASTDSICGEPITTKYAGDIAYLTDAFLRQTGSFRLHPTLENTPWFL